MSDTLYAQPIVLWQPAPPPTAKPRPVPAVARVETEGASESAPVTSGPVEVHRVILASPTNEQRDLPVGARCAFTAGDGHWCCAEVLEVSFMRLRIRVDSVGGQSVDPFELTFGKTWPVTLGTEEDAQPCAIAAEAAADALGATMASAGTPRRDGSGHMRMNWKPMTDAELNAAVTRENLKASHARPNLHAAVAELQALRAASSRSDAGELARAAFEEWVTAPPYEYEIRRFDTYNKAECAWPGQYRDIAVQLAWEAWQAVAPATPPAGPALEWRETAKELPPVNRAVLLFRFRAFYIGVRSDYDRWEIDGVDEPQPFTECVWWMPLPEPPVAALAGTGTTTTGEQG